MRVLLHWWQSIRDIDIKWERQVVYAQEASFEYENCEGICLIIREDRNRLSHVIKAIGIPQNITEMLEGLNSVYLNQNLDLYVKGKIINSEDFELRIAEYVV